MRPGSARSGLTQTILSLSLIRTSGLRCGSEKCASGFNVTVPYKTVSRYDKVSTEARTIQAVNTVYKKGGSVQHQHRHGRIPAFPGQDEVLSRGKRAVVLGAGGASRAVVYGLSKEDAAAVTIGDVVPEKAGRIAEAIAGIFPKTDCRAFAAGDPGIRDRIEEADLVINATPLGLKSEDPLAVSQEWIPKAGRRPKLFMDLIYNPERTRFLKIAGRRGHKTLNGLGMLFYQGVRAFECWSGGKAPLSAMKTALLEALQGKGKS